MKRIIKYVLLLASFSLITTSCKKDEESIVVKSEAEKIGEELKKMYSEKNLQQVNTYIEGQLLTVNTTFEIDKQYLILVSEDAGLYYKFDLNKLNYYKIVSADSTLVLWF